MGPAVTSAHIIMSPSASALLMQATHMDQAVEGMHSGLPRSYSWVPVMHADAEGVGAVPSLLRNASLQRAHDAVSSKQYLVPSSQALHLLCTGEDLQCDSDTQCFRLGPAGCNLLKSGC